MCRHSWEASERAPASEWPATAQAAGGVAGERSRRSSVCHLLDAALCREVRVDLGPAVAVEVEQRAGVLLAPVEVAVGDDQLVLLRASGGEDFAGRGNDARVAQGRHALLDPALGDADYKRAVL